jgi:hypothetical protein
MFCKKIFYNFSLAMRGNMLYNNSIMGEYIFFYYYKRLKEKGSAPKLALAAISGGIRTHD